MPNESNAHMCFCGKEAKRNVKQQKPQDKHPESPKHCTVGTPCSQNSASITHSDYRKTSNLQSSVKRFTIADGMKLFPLPHPTEL